MLGDDNALTAMHLRNLGVLLDELDRVDEAEKAYRDSQAVLTKRLGPEHANLGSSYANLAVLLGRRGKTQEAEALYKRSLEVRRKTLGPNHPMLGQTLQLTALFYLNQERLDESEATYREALALFRGINPKHFEVGKCLNGLALIASTPGRYGEAEKTMQEVEALFREVLGEKHSFTWQVRGNRASQIVLQGRLEEAEPMQREVAEKLAALNGKDSAEAVDARARLGETLRLRGRPAEAEPIHREALQIALRLEGEKSPVGGAPALPDRTGPDRLRPPRRPRRGAHAAGRLDRDAREPDAAAPPPGRSPRGAWSARSGSGALDPLAEAYGPLSRRLKVFVRKTAICPRVMGSDGQYRPPPQPAVMPRLKRSSIQSAYGPGQGRRRRSTGAGRGDVARALALFNRKTAICSRVTERSDSNCRRRSRP